MAISDYRTAFLDFTTNLPVQDFRAIKDTAVFNAASTNLALNTSLDKVSIPNLPLESLVKDSLASVKSALPTSPSLSNIIDPIKESVTDLLPPKFKTVLDDASNNGMGGALDNMFGKISNLSAKSLCDLINMALGINILGLMLNLSADMRKRLLMLAILALLSKLCNTKLNDLGNPSKIINGDDLKAIGKSVTKNLVNSTSMGGISKIIPKAANPMFKVMNTLGKAPNIFSKSNIPTLNPNILKLPTVGISI